jgi:NodT family efflux transporter outer membrane factor (OMF) lipoprotein
VSYDLDVFGGNRRAYESLVAQADAQRYAWQAARISLAANVVVSAVQAASLHDQIEEVDRILQLEGEQLDLLRRQSQLGAIAEAAVLAQENLLAAENQQRAALQQQLAQQQDLLAALGGRLPAEQRMPSLRLDAFRLPDELPLQLPARLIEQRPDVRAAEALLHAASAEVGVAIAHRLPQVTLSAADGTSAIRFIDLFKKGSAFFDIAVDVSQPLFQGGSLYHRQRAAEAAYQQAAAQYRATVIAASQNVADTLQALQNDAEALRAAAQLEQAAAQTLALAQRQFALGDTNALAPLAAEQAYHQAVLGRRQAEAARLMDTAALFEALGGGWGNHTAGEP